jgi:arsenate reductase
MINIYHNSRCKKSREAMEYLREKNINFNVIDYLNQNLSEEKLSSLLKKLGIRPIELVRKNESIWKENYKNKEISEVELIRILSLNPKLIERPIIETKKNAIIARPLEHLVNFLVKK